ncbi:MAG: serine/threonine-protein phosphatase [Deltaproteobacteria bacterium]|nr:serine/threonine-protein phosphatase [Deltaproteobacteria bacterium]
MPPNGDFGVKAFYFSDVGAVRAHNEDSLLCGEMVVSKGDSPDVWEKELPHEAFLVAVADGMGGGPGGEEASALVLRNLKKIDLSQFGRKSQDVVTEVIYGAAREMVALGRARPALAGLGSTVAGLWVKGDKALAFNCGDSRIYRVRHGFFDLLSKDHSLVYELFARGGISEEEMATHPLKHVLTASIQDSPDEPKLFFREVKILPGDSFFLCSDGVWEAVTRAELESFIEIGSPLLGSHLLAQALSSRECRDNISFLWLAKEELVSWDEESESGTIAFIKS